MLDHEMFGAFADPRQKEYVGLIRESGNHLLAVVTSILDVSKIDCGSYPIEPRAFPLRRRGRDLPLDDAAAGRRRSR